MNETKNLLNARAIWEAAQIGPALSLLDEAQIAYDANTPGGDVPNRPMTTSERNELHKNIREAIQKTFNPKFCKVYDCDSKPECNTCRRLYDIIFTDPPCVDHG